MGRLRYIGNGFEVKETKSFAEEFIQRVKAFINGNPQRKKLLLIIFVLAIIPLTVISALTVQNLTQHAGGGTTVRISDQSGNTR